jgi:hypothetical protein
LLIEWPQGKFKETCCKGETEMVDANPNETPKIEINQENLYHEETFTDLKVGWIRRLTPVTPDGNRDKSRELLFIGMTNLVTPQGQIPIQAQIPAKTLPEAMKKFPESMEKAVKQVVERAMEIQRQATSRIITP